MRRPPIIANAHRIILGLILLSILIPDKLGVAQNLALVHAKLYPSPTARPIENATIFVRDGRIYSVGSGAKTRPPRGATVLDCNGLIVTAGFWNSHVHILTQGLMRAEN